MVAILEEEEEYFGMIRTALWKVIHCRTLSQPGFNPIELAYTGCGKKSSPLKFFAVFSATAWNFNLKFYTFIC